MNTPTKNGQHNASETATAPRSRRRRRRSRPAHNGAANGQGAASAAPVVDTPTDSRGETPPGDEGSPVKSKRRRRRRRAKGVPPAIADGANGEAPAVEQPLAATPTTAPEAAAPTAETPSPAKPRRRRRRKGAAQAAVEGAVPALDGVAPDTIEEAQESDADAESPLLPADIQIAKWPPQIRGHEMVINVTGEDECRVAILQDGRLEELFIERQSAESHVGNIYKGRITNVEPSIQAAFIDFGHPKNGFLHISDVQPQYFPSGGHPESVGKKVPRRDRPPIQRCFRRGQEVIVQITKEGVGTKGPTLTTYLSVPGRFIVMMPGMDHLGVSRKIEDEVERRKMRDLLAQLSLPEGMGFILRTAGMDQSKRELQRDLNYLLRLWKNVSQRIENLPPPAELYQETDLVIRTLRDVYTSDFERIVVDNAETARKAWDFLHVAAPRAGQVVELYDKSKPIFHAYGIEPQIERINSRHVPLPLGGSLVIDSTEAMVAIDVNSGKFRDVDDAEEAAFKINMEAADEIARQLRLRDLGGLIVCDFIDMRFDRHKRAVEKTLRDALRKHKERARILRMSQFGLIEMTRQRQRPSIKRSIYEDCPHCRGSGLIKTAESMSLEVMRILQLAAHRQDVHRITLTASPKVALLVLNERRAAVQQLQESSGKRVAVQMDPTFAIDQVACACEDNRGRPVTIDA